MSITKVNNKQCNQVAKLYSAVGTDSVNYHVHSFKCKIWIFLFLSLTKLHIQIF